MLSNPLTTARDLAILSARPGPQARFAYASYFYDRRNLLLYNAPLWSGDRAWSLAKDWNSRIATRSDDRALTRHHFDHECLVHAKSIYLEVADRWPNSPEAPKAIYAAACAARRLATFNAWWRAHRVGDQMFAESVRLMRRLARRYPRHPLAAKARKYAAVFATERREARVERLLNLRR